MRVSWCHRYRRFLLVGLALAAALQLPSAFGQIAQPNPAPPDLAAAMEQYRKALDAYNAAHERYSAIANAYWSAISEKRQLRNAKRTHGEPLAIDDYVLDQPPVYTGPPKPKNPLKPEAPGHRAYVPVVADFLAAAQQEFNFAPRLPQSDS